MFNGFVNWDDEVYITENQDIQALTINNISRIFSRYYGGAYVPITILSFALDHLLYGLDPAGFHATNLIMHILNVLLIFWLSYLFGRKLIVAFLTALFFAIHPLHVEPVAWSTGRKDLLYAFFFIASLISHIYYRYQNRSRYYIASLILFVLALFSKPVAITLPFVILIIEYSLSGQLNKRLVIRILPYFVLSAIFFYIAVIAQQSAGAFPQERLHLFQQINISLSSMIFYIFRMFVPTRLSCVYPVQNYWFAPLFVAVALAIIIFSLRYFRAIAGAILTFIIMMLPVMQIVPVGQPLSDRYTYLSITGFFFLIAMGVSIVYYRAKAVLKAGIVAVVVILTIILSILSNSQSRIWKDGMTLWSHAINTYPNISLSYANRGILLACNGNSRGALEDFDRALALNPGYVKVYVHRANIYATLGDYDRALADYDQALKIDSTYLDAYHNRAVLYYNAGDYQRSLEELLKIKALGGVVPDQVLYYIKSLIDKSK